MPTDDFQQQFEKVLTEFGLMDRVNPFAEVPPLTPELAWRCLIAAMDKGFAMGGEKGAGINAGDYCIRIGGIEDGSYLHIHNADPAEALITGIAAALEK
jgi:hypothetical protein